jgi:hypothetical protein
MKLSKPTASEMKEAQVTSAQYLAEGISSNRTITSRQVKILASIYAVSRRGVCVELPAIDGKSPVFNRAWRPVRDTASAEEWALIKVCAVHNGMFTTTAKVGKAYLVPADMVTRGPAPKGW